MLCFHPLSMGYTIGINFCLFCIQMKQSNVLEAVYVLQGVPIFRCPWCAFLCSEIEYVHVHMTINHRTEFDRFDDLTISQIEDGITALNFTLEHLYAALLSGTTADSLEDAITIMERTLPMICVAAETQTEHQITEKTENPDEKDQSE